MNDSNRMTVFFFGTVFLIILVISSMIYVFQLSYDKDKEPLDLYCQNKGYDEAIDLNIKSFGGQKFIECVKEIVSFDRGVAHFEVVNDMILYDGGNYD